MTPVRRSLVFIAVLVMACAAHPAPLFADTISDIQAQIDQVNSQKAELDAQIAQYQKQLDALGTQHQTLQSSITSLSTSQSQLLAKIKSTQKSIDAANLKLAQLSSEIDTTQGSIDLERQAVAASLRDIASADDVPLVATLFASDSLATVWAAVDADNQLAATLQGHTHSLAQAKDMLSTEVTSVAAQHDQLSSLGSTLTTQNKQLTVTKQAQQQLLEQTKSKESTYEQLIATKKAQEAQFEKTLSDLQAQLAPVSSGSIPQAGSGILKWPVSIAFEQSCAGKSSALGNPYCVTQYFGNTSFAAAHAAVYNGMGHDGIDIGMPIGTPVLAALGGTVLATGNTDIKSPSGQQCYSFGKWVMVQHPNGLSTLYAHLSSIEATKGQVVTTGQEIGLSGMTGYATGPHLHFGVYASSGVQIMDLGKWRGSGGTPCTDAGAVLPVAPNNAYLNPMAYL
ncbi:MAG TPA: peptidoglycan DD-metalloendopeptidase family protein [Candidatus Paceibacterota bacterium]|nr:peptidoglycan DD-metalloendopeptidase family protein [Candidatus Paceibacterota bacterium]